MKKAIRKAFGSLKGIKDEQIFTSLNKVNETLTMLSILKEAEVVTVSSLESLLLFIPGSKWSVISKLMQPNRVECDSQESDTNEFVKVAAALQSLINHMLSSIENFLSHVENLHICIQNLESIDIFGADGTQTSEQLCISSPPSISPYFLLQQE
ncbi:hypothetical protein JHK82_032769 [Glycine max]|nr:hypothetical protein JHK82_032769 [Glycine max]KAG5139330.1 hypothetical protein JHK84_033098 [Glycine max]